MKKFINLKSLVLVLLFAAVPFCAGVYVEKAAAQESEAQAVIAQAPQAPQAPAAQAEPSYEYTAQPGDSYTLMARKAIQTYGITSKTNLSQSQIIYAETLLTQEAGLPQLNVGQKVSIKESTVKSWVEKATKLTDAQKTAWDAYTAGVNFNTNDVGQ